MNQGEEKLHHRLRVPHGDNQTAPYLSLRAASLIKQSPLLALGILDSRRPAMVKDMGQHSGLCNASCRIANRTLGTDKMISGRAADLKNRRRVKLYGRMVTGSLSNGDAEQAQLIVHILYYKD
ncbi:hypothetical protein E8E15_000326 [Penicillium rubens]|nr:hypothetical protein E8E15_000326 [Penicillium rubens]